MKIVKLIQGQDNKEIFGNIGSWVTNINVHKELGMHITSQNDDIWYLVFLNEVTIGFAVTRKTKSTNALHVRFVYADPETKKSLIEKILSDANKDSLSSVWTNDRENEKLWKELKFVFSKRARGEFGRWEKVIKASSKGDKNV